MRVDIDPEVNPHFVRNMLDLNDIGTFDVIYSCHNLEHLYPYEVPRALKEFHRVLNENGSVLIIVPDLEDVKPDVKRLLDCGMGPICGLDMYYGHHAVLEAQPYMAHHCGFVAPILQSVMEAAGFANVSTTRGQNYNLIGAGDKNGKIHS